MEIFIILKFIVDMFWDFKILNISYMFVCIWIFIVLFFTQNINYKVIKADLVILFFMVVSIVSLLISKDISKGVIDFIKIITLFFLYGLGRIWRWNFEINKVSFFSILLLFSLFIYSILGLGYVNWGTVKTFIGPYYFKTDLAVAVIIFLIFILSSNLNKYFKIMSFFISLYLVFIANSRISIPLLGLIALLPFFNIKSFYVHIGRSLSILLCVLLIVVIVLSTLDFSKLGMIGFDIKDPFSDKATQGRNQIWSAVIEYYNASPLIEKIFGSGMAADLIAAEKYSQPNIFESSRAHNSYLWLLLCTGWVGLLSMILFFVTVISEIKWKIRNNYINQNEVFIFTSLLVVFIGMSISVELIIRTQFTYILFLYAGLCCNRNKLRIAK